MALIVRSHSNLSRSSLKTAEEPHISGAFVNGARNLLEQYSSSMERFGIVQKLFGVTRVRSGDIAFISQKEFLQIT
jgi:hypothetical protein